MNVRIAFGAILTGFMFFSAQIAVANTGNACDVNKDGIVDDTDVDIVILHINTYGSTDSLSDGLSEFSWNDTDIRDLVGSLGSENVLYNLSLLGVSSNDEASVNYMTTWERKDVTGDGYIVAADVLAIINWINSH